MLLLSTVFSFFIFTEHCNTPPSSFWSKHWSEKQLLFSLLCMREKLGGNKSFLPPWLISLSCCWWWFWYILLQSPLTPAHICVTVKLIVLQISSLESKVKTIPVVLNEHLTHLKNAAITLYVLINAKLCYCFSFVANTWTHHYLI